MLIDILSDGSERVKYDNEGYFSYIRRARLSSYPDFCADSHWHDDLEFIAVLTGAMQYNVNGEIIALHPGQGIMVNSRQLHYGFSEGKEECEFLCILLHPLLLCASAGIEAELVSPFILGGAPYLFLDGGTAWQGWILELLKGMYAGRGDDFAALSVQRDFFEIWRLILENTGSAAQAQSGRKGQLSLLKAMLSFIQGSYAEKITLGDIAKAGKVCKSTCLATFREILHTTPIEFLLQLRLKKAAALLSSTDKPVTEIASETGFFSASYFTKIFKRELGCTPREYRAGTGSRY